MLFKNKIRKINILEIILKPKSKNGLLLFTGNTLFESFLYLALNNRRLEYSFKLPNQKQVFFFQTFKKLSNTKWSVIKIER